MRKRRFGTARPKRPTIERVARSRELPASAHWQAAFWGTNYPKLLAVKRRYDPDGLFFVHDGVGSEGWSGEGFVPPT